MKKIKLGAWIFILAIFESVVFNYMRIDGMIPAALMVFIISAALLEDDFTPIACISVISAAASASLGMGNFVITFFMYSLFGIWVFYVKKRPRYMKKFVKAIIHTLLLSAISQTILHISMHFNLDLQTIISKIIASGIYNLIMVIIIYPLLELSVYDGSKNKKLII